MMTTSATDANLIKINPHIKTAIIYSIEHLFDYIVEIKEGNKSYYVSHGNEPLRFGNMEDARKAALKENVKEAYLALSKTSAETDLSTRDTHPHVIYDYSPVALTIEK